MEGLAGAGFRQAAVGRLHVDTAVVEMAATPPPNPGELLDYLVILTALLPGLGQEAQQGPGAVPFGGVVI